MTGVRVGIDVGGTFTDIVVLHADGTVRTRKLLSSPDDYSRAESGAKRTTPLVYHRIGERLLIIASTGGGPRNPGWFDNLEKNPSVRVELGDEAWEGRAVVLSGAERDALFGAVVKATPTFGRYQERTQRTIPVVELLPAKQ